jgi:hypothetical protein
MAHGHAVDEVHEARENRKSVFMGLGFAIVWLLIVGAISYVWAANAGGGEAEGGAAPAGQQAH